MNREVLPLFREDQIDPGGCEVVAAHVGREGKVILHRCTVNRVRMVPLEPNALRLDVKLTTTAGSSGNSRRAGLMSPRPLKMSAATISFSSLHASSQPSLRSCSPN